MQPIGPLMREHRLIERMVTLLNTELERMTATNLADLERLAVCFDFLRNYADAAHHGKEENIFFRELSKKQLSGEHRRVMDELISEHAAPRKAVQALKGAHQAYASGNHESLKDIIEGVRTLTSLYPAHIKKEDEAFFYPAQEYLTKAE